MSLQRSSERVPPFDRPRIVTYGSLFVLLLVSAVLDVAVPTLVRRMDGWLRADPDPLLFGNVVLEPRLIGALGYAMLVLVAVAAVFLLSGRVRETWRGIGWDQRVTLGALTVLVSYVGSYALLGTTAVPVFPADLLTTVLSGGASAAILGLGYARLRGIDLGIDLPDGDAVPVVGAAVAVSCAVGAVPILVLAATGGLSTLGFWAGGGLGFAPSYSVGWVVESVLFPAAVIGVGSAFLYNGAVQAGIERLAGPDGAIAGVIAALGFLLWSSVATIPSNPLGVAATVAVVVALGVLAAALAATAAPGLVAATDLSATLVAVLVGVAVAQIALLVPLVAGGVPGLVSLASVVSYAVVAAIAAVGYDRTQSVWVPALAFATYLAATDLARVLAVALV